MHNDRKSIMSNKDEKELFFLLKVEQALKCFWQSEQVVGIFVSASCNVGICSCGL